ncbi:MAG: ECF-type sigma factor [Gemmatimonadaceae bacterium]|nr:ECF-type sigma factor [Gemmatimonadaceae bacterium]
MGMTLDGSLTGPESSHDVGVGVATGATTAPTTRGLDPAVYDELKRIARHHLRTRASAATISTTDLLHEAWLKVGGPADPRWRDRAHFFGSASRAMRQLLVDYARHRHAAKRGGGAAPVTLTDAESALAVQLDDLIALDDALEQLRGVSERLCRVVELRFFAGLEEEEVAEVLGVTSRTVRRDWTKARLLLAEALGTE